MKAVTSSTPSLFLSLLLSSPHLSPHHNHKANMVLSLLNASLTNPSPTTLISSNRLRIPSHRQGTVLQIVSCRRKPELSKSTNFSQESSSGRALEQIFLQKSGFLVAAASLAVVLWSSPGDFSAFLAYSCSFTTWVF